MGERSSAQASAREGGAGTVRAATPDNLRRLRELTGHEFRDVERLDRALTHSSVGGGAHGAEGEAHYERLEFLGDRVLGLLIAEMLHEKFPDATEGELSVRLNALVNAEACAQVADELRLHEMIATGADVKRLTGKRMQNVRADVVESLIAAIYLEGGLEDARAFVHRYWKGRSESVNSGRRDGKTELQEWAHARGLDTPDYRVLRREGPDHEPTFTVVVSLDGEERARGRGRSKRIAEQAAAEKVLRAENVWDAS